MDSHASAEVGQVQKSRKLCARKNVMLQSYPNDVFNGEYLEKCSLKCSKS